jgi:hypothetical protein
LETSIHGNIMPLRDEFFPQGRRPEQINWCFTLTMQSPYRTNDTKLFRTWRTPQAGSSVLFTEYSTIRLLLIWKSEEWLNWEIRSESTRTVTWSRWNVESNSDHRIAGRVSQLNYQTRTSSWNRW